MASLQIFVKKNGGFNLISKEEFASLPSADRVNMILNKEIKFVDTDGKPVRAKDALSQLKG